MSEDCIFCKIIRGELPCTKVYEDDCVLAFLDIGPIIKGHTLVIPRQHVDSLTAVPTAALHRVIDVVQRVAAAQLAGLGADGVNITQANGEVAGQVVPHMHVHVIPRFAGDGHSWNWNAKSYDDTDEMAAIAARIRTQLDPSASAPAGGTA